MTPEVYDLRDGVRLWLPLGEGVGLTVDLEDSAAQDLVDIVQNKLNGRCLS